MDTYYKRESVSSDGELLAQRTQKFYNPMKEGYGYNFKYKSAMTKSYLSISLPECFSDAELGRIYKISRMIYSKSNLLAKRTNGGIVPLTREEIHEKIGLHRTKFVQFWKKLIENKIIKSIPISGKNFFCISPLYFNSTVYIPVDIFIAFQEELKEHLSKRVFEAYMDMHASGNYMPIIMTDGDVEGEEYL